MNKKEFYEVYRQVRFIFTATSTYAVKLNIDAPSYNIQHDILDGLHESVRYAIYNKYKRTYYPIADSRWAISENSKF